MGGRTSNLPLPILPRLTHLAFFGLTVDVIDVVAGLILPSLYTLRMEIDHATKESPGDYMNVAWYCLFDKVTTLILQLDTWDANLMGRVLRRMLHLRCLDLCKCSSDVTNMFHHVFLTCSRYFPDVTLVILGSTLPQITIESILRNRVGPASDLHLIVPQTHLRSGPIAEHFLVGLFVHSRSFFTTVDLWLDDCIIP